MFVKKFIAIIITAKGGPYIYFLNAASLLARLSPCDEERSDE